MSGMRPSRYQAPNTLPPPDVAGVITLDQVRTQPRTQNEYVDTPRSPLGQGGGHHKSSPEVFVPTQAVVPRDRVVLPSRKSTGNSIIRQQPISTSPPLKKDLQQDKELESGENESNSIYCFKCKKCMCGACTTPRELPQKWLCGVKVSPETTVEYCTCMCCVKAIFYHCSKDEQDSESCDAEPCACCSRPHCCQRWTCMLAMSLCLPCMCMYLPVKCALTGCTAIYDKLTRPGCTCNTANNASKKSSSRNKVDSQYRGLLVESDRESSSYS